MKLIHENGRTLAPIDSLQPWQDNPRKISDEKLNQLIQDIKDVESIDPDTDGQFKPLIITQDGIVVGGNMRLRAYKKLGKTKLWVSMVNTTDPKEAFRIAIRDNMKYGEYNEEMLEHTIEKLELEIEDIEGLEVDFGDVTLLSELLPTESDDENDEADEAPAVDDSPAISKLGKVYRLGRHRLMCGSATDPEHAKTLMGKATPSLIFTDPPYGIDIVDKKGKVGGGSKKNPTREYSAVIGDETTDTARDFYAVWSELCERSIIWGGNYFTDFLPFSDGWVIWDKRGGMASNDFADGEMAWCSFHTPVRIYKQIWNGYIREGEKVERVHPTQKPVRTLAEIITDFSEEDDNIVDVFGGSGSTLIAAEQTNRTCFMMELDPKYIDIIRKRYHIHTTGDEDGWEKATPEAT